MTEHEVTVEAPAGGGRFLIATIHGSVSGDTLRVILHQLEDAAARLREARTSNAWPLVVPVMDNVSLAWADPVGEGRVREIIHEELQAFRVELLRETHLQAATGGMLP